MANPSEINFSFIRGVPNYKPEVKCKRFIDIKHRNEPRFNIFPPLVLELVHVSQWKPKEIGFVLLIFEKFLFEF